MSKRKQSGKNILKAWPYFPVELKTHLVAVTRRDMAEVPFLDLQTIIKAMRLTLRDIRVLHSLNTGRLDIGFGYYSFGAIQDRTGLIRRQVCRACRLLRRRWLADFKNGLWTEDGEPAGAGYGITAAGRALANLINEVEEGQTSSGIDVQAATLAVRLW